MGGEKSPPTFMDKETKKLAKKLGADTSKQAKKKEMTSDELLDKHLNDLKDSSINGRTNIGGVKTYSV